VRGAGAMFPAPLFLYRTKRDTINIRIPQNSKAVLRYDDSKRERIDNEEIDGYGSTCRDTPDRIRL
jgi:hypothetical protein